jgi:hypothetical protein
MSQKPVDITVPVNDPNQDETEEEKVKREKQKRIQLGLNEKKIEENEELVSVNEG